MSKRIAVWSVVLFVLVVPGIINGQTLELEFSTYLGGSGDDYGYGIDVDSASCTYIAGKTSSLNFPTANPYNPGFSSTWSAYIAKFDSTGSTLLYSTYIGGSDQDIGEEVAVDVIGNAYLTGYTDSADFPTLDPYQAA